MLKISQLVTCEAAKVFFFFFRISSHSKVSNSTPPPCPPHTHTGGEEGGTTSISDPSFFLPENNYEVSAAGSHVEQDSENHMDSQGFLLRATVQPNDQQVMMIMEGWKTTAQRRTTCIYVGDQGLRRLLVHFGEKRRHEESMKMTLMVCSGDEEEGDRQW